MIKDVVKLTTRSFTCHAAILVIILVSTAFVDGAVAASGKRISLTLGGSHVWTMASSWSDRLETSLITAGLDETDPGGCFWLGCRDPEVRPITKFASDESLWIIAGVNLGQRFEIRGRFVFRGELGTTAGYCFDWFDSTSVSYDLYFKPWVAVWAASLMYELRDGLSIGIGPALTVANIKCQSWVVSRTPFSWTYTEDDISRNILGAVVELAYRLPLKSWLFADIGGQYFLTPQTSIGPIELTQQDGTIGRTMPETKLNLSWGQIGLGLGVAF